MMLDYAVPNYLPYWKRNSDTGEIIGYYVDLLEELSRSVGFNYTIEDSSEFQTYDSLGKIAKLNISKNNKTTLVKALASNKLDLIMGDLSVTPERAAVIDFTIPFQAEIYYITTKITKLNTSFYFSMFKPLSLEVWIAILVSLITGAGIITLLNLNLLF